MKTAEKQEFTPGPWKMLDYSRVCGEECIYIEGQRSGIATVFVDNEDEGIDEANARLIVAAPDLLKALEAMVEDVCQLQLTDANVLLAKAAIKKARGEA